MEIIILLFAFVPSMLIGLHVLLYFFKIKLLHDAGLYLISWYYSLVLVIGLRWTENLFDSCCGAIISSEHLISIYVFIGTSFLNLIYLSLRKSTAPPLPECLSNGLLLIFMLFIVLLSLHLNSTSFYVFFAAPYLFVLSFYVLRNHQLFRKEYHDYPFSSSKKWQQVLLKLLFLPVWKKSGFLLLIASPMLLLISLVMMLFGQPADSLIQAFTQTSDYGFSQLNEACDNIRCGEHYLCSVAANGNPKIVKPLRYGKRNGGKIICNRQLLVSNAFEEMLQQKLPALHQFTRNQYNSVGKKIHKYYFLFEKKWVSNAVYCFMKPAEWFFLICLYCTDKNPEKRISRQYPMN